MCIRDRNTASCGVGTSVFLCSGWGQKWVRLVFDGLGAQRGRLAGGSACPTRLHLALWWHGGEARIGRAGRKLLNGNGIKSWSLGTGSAERYGITSDERRAIVNLPSCRPAKRCGNGVLDGHRIRHALRSIENLETHHVAAGVVVQDDAGLILIAFRDRRVAQQDAEDVHFGVIYDFHSTLQYFSI